MTKKKKLHHINLFIKISIIVAVLVVFVVLGIFLRPMWTFENSKMTKWLKLSEEQRLSTVNQVAKDIEKPDLLIKCVTKIADLSDSENMVIRDAIAICYNGIKINTAETVKDEK